MAQMKIMKHIHNKKIQLVIQRSSKQVFTSHKAPRIQAEDEGDMPRRMMIMMIKTPHHVNQHSKKDKIYNPSLHTMYHSHMKVLYMITSTQQKS